MPEIMEEIRKKVRPVWAGAELLAREITVRARTLTTEEAIGHPEGDDFPLQKGKERLMQAEFDGALGQAFTDRFGDFSGTLQEILEMPLNNNYRRAVFVAALNAVQRHLGEASGTVHCRDKEPGQCAAAMVEHIKERYGPVKVTQVGFQPRMVENLAAAFPYRILDLDPDNIGQKKYGAVVEGADKTDEAVEWADLLVVTGTTLANGTINRFLTGKPVIFYGTTIAGAAELMGWERFCACSH